MATEHGSNGPEALMVVMTDTLPETNSKFATENRPKRQQKGKDRLPHKHFSGAMLVSRRTQIQGGYLGPSKWA